MRAKFVAAQAANASDAGNAPKGGGKKGDGKKGHGKSKSKSKGGAKNNEGADQSSAPKPPDVAAMSDTRPKPGAKYKNVLICASSSTAAFLESPHTLRKIMILVRCVCSSS